jgi:hypothetical protein
VAAACRRQAPGLDGAAQLVVQLTCQVLAAIDDNMQFHTDEASGAIGVSARLPLLRDGQ